MSSPASRTPAVAQSWDDVERLMYADEPANFLLADEPANILRWRWGGAAAMVDALRRDPDTRILPGRLPSGGDEFRVQVRKKTEPRVASISLTGRKFWGKGRRT